MSVEGIPGCGGGNAGGGGTNVVADHDMVETVLNMSDGTHDGRTVVVHDDPVLLNNGIWEWNATISTHVQTVQFTGQTFQSSSPYQPASAVTITIDSGHLSAKGISPLPFTPANGNAMLLAVSGGGLQMPGVDYTYVPGTNSISWDGTPLEADIQVGDKLVIYPISL